MTWTPPGGPLRGTVVPPPPLLCPKRSGLAVASLVCGIASPCTAGLSAIPGIILGIVALRRVRASGGRLAGEGLAAAGVVTSAVGMLILLVAMVIAVTGLLVGGTVRHLVGPAAEVRSARGNAARSMIAVSLLCHAARAYAAEHGGRLPPAEGYPSALEKYMGETSSDVLAATGDRRIAMNAALAGVSLESIGEPGRTVLFFETQPGGGRVGGRELLRPLAGPDEAYVIGFADGHVVWVDADGLKDLLWLPGGGDLISL
jgi:hypothetical protein